MLNESQAKRILSAYGIAVSQPLAAQSAEEAVALAKQLGFPVVLKVVSPQITHKTDVGGVELNLASETEVRAAYERIVHAVREKRPDAIVQAVTVQPMVVQASGIELIVGMKKDPVFGPVIMVGAGGIAAELYRDTALALPPLNERLTLRMLESLRAWPLIVGYRGRGPIVDQGKLIELLLRFSQLVADFPELKEADINPVLARGRELVALDARMSLDPQAIGRNNAGYAHLAIRPYPLERVQQVRLKDGTEITLRPIRPEDEGLWRGLLSRCSRETFWSRFRYLFKFDDHASAVRFCFVDYDREFTMVAEHGEGAQRQLVGVARIVEERGNGSADLGILIDDRWQGRGLGTLMTRVCLESVDCTRIRSVHADTLRTNQPMIRILKRLGFDLEPGEDRTLCRGSIAL
jgi:acetyltransferase